MASRQGENRGRGIELSDLLGGLSDMRVTVMGGPCPEDVDLKSYDAIALGITDDSREVQPGFVFVAVPGVHVDGHRYIPQAIAAGAIAIIGERPATALGCGDLCPSSREREVYSSSLIYVRVPNARKALGWLHAKWWGYPSRQLTLIGVTGTDGKTTTVNLLYAMLKAAGIRAGMISTINAQIGDLNLETGLHTTTPPSAEVQHYLAEMVSSGVTHAVLEATSEGLAQYRLAGCDFDVAVVTNITHEHLNYHGTWEAYREAKAMLFRNVVRASAKPERSKIAVLNCDDAQSYDYLAEIVYPQKGIDLLISYGIDRAEVTGGALGDLRQQNPLCDKDLSCLQEQGDVCVAVRAEDVRFDASGLMFTLQSPWGSAEIVSSLLGRYNVSNILAAAAAALALGVTPSALAEGVASVRGVPGRMERIVVGQSESDGDVHPPSALMKRSERTSRGVLAIVDFAHTPNALRRTLEAVRKMLESGRRGLRPLDDSIRRRVILVFGSAGLRDQAKRRMMGEVAGQMADLVMITAEDPRTESLDHIMAEIAEGMQSQGRREGVDYWRVSDRGEAMLRAVQMARPGDVVIACGKGHEQSMCFGEQEYPWDDRTAMRLALRGERLATLPTATNV